MKGGQQYGPIETEALLALLRDGTLTPETMVLKEGAADWLPIRGFPELASAAAPGPKAAGPPVSFATPPAGGEAPDPADVEKNKVFAILAYIGILFLVPLLAAKDSKFARYHTNQGVVLFLTWFVLCFGAAIIGFLPFLHFIGCLLWPAIMICMFVLMVMGIINAAGGQCKPLPVIGQYTLLK